MDIVSCRGGYFVQCRAIRVIGGGGGESRGRRSREDDVDTAREGFEFGRDGFPGLSAHDDGILLGRIGCCAGEVFEEFHVAWELPWK